MDREELKYWIALKGIEGLGNVGFRNLIDAVGSPRNVFDTAQQALMVIPGIGRKIASRIAAFNDWQEIEKELETALRLNVSIITCRDPLYPRDLLQIYDYPAYLYVKGSFAPSDINVAVVGSRIASTYGRFATEKLCRELALRGVTIVSGMARGIDSAAHRGALAGRGRTIAVLGCGLDIVYPSENEKLYGEIAASGAVITEFPFGTPPNGPNFPARNRIISGISLGVVVVEATDKSGSLITAKLALEQNREVFAVPGSIDSPGSKGTNRLIKQGAKLVEHIDDILDEILPKVERMHSPAVVPPRAPSEPPREKSRQGTGASLRADTSGLTDQENLVLQSVAASPIDIDSIIRKTNLKPNEVLNILLTLELQGLVKQMPGKIFLRME